MHNFDVVNGEQTISGNLVQVEVVEVHHDGTPSAETILSNSKHLRVISSGEYHLGVYTPKGRRLIRVTGGTVVNFIVDGVLAATVGAEDLPEFAVSR